MRVGLSWPQGDGYWGQVRVHGIHYTILLTSVYN